MASTSAIAEEKPYEEGTIWSVGLIRTEANMQEQYIKDLSNVWVKVMQAAKEEGLILSYKVLAGESANPDDWDIMLLAEFENYAALDGIDNKLDKLVVQLLGEEEEQIKASLEREKIRDSYGSKLMQEIIFK
jgi:hypothetical protein